MIVKISKLSDICKVPTRYQKYITQLFTQIALAYKEDSAEMDLDPIGAIFFVPNLNSFEDYHRFGLSAPISKHRFEDIVVKDGVVTGTIVLSNSVAITLVGSPTAFVNYLDEEDIYNA